MKTRSIWEIVVAALILAALGSMIYFYNWQRSRAVQMEAEIQNLKVRLEMAARSAATNLPAQSAETEPTESTDGKPHQRPIHPPAGPVITPADLENARAELASARSSIQDLQHRLDETHGEVRRLQEEITRLNTAADDSKESLAANARLIEALQAEVKSKDARMVQMQIDTRNIRDENKKNSDRLNDISKAAKDLEDLNRRREQALNNILRRYRDVTDQFRSMTLRLDRQSENAPASIPELSRIQSAIVTAEDDLRTLNGLNAQALRLTQAIGKR